MDKKVVFKLIVAAAVISDGKLLIIQRSLKDESFPGLWELPGGGKEPFEDAKSGVAREVKEEAGLDVEILEPIDVFNYTTEKNNEIRDATQISFLAKPIGNVNVKLSQEHENYVWISPEELDNYGLSNETKSIINKAFKKIAT